DGVPDSAELFAFADNDRVTGPFDLAKVLDAAARAQMKGVRNADEYSFGISTSPEISIDDHDVIHGSVYMTAPNSRHDLIYELAAQVTRAADALDAKVVSVSQYLGPYISVIVH
ncbi:MAG TPA: hypothetical protein VMR17_21065, partial [Xanthobacteraceae bacterium]|nr:hypothetical protein [Xanthobacteraceae bacterium]